MHIKLYDKLCAINIIANNVSYYENVLCRYIVNLRASSPARTKRNS